MADEEKPLLNDLHNPGKQPVSQGTTGEMSRPNNLQRIAQKKAMVKNYSRTKKLEKLAVYSSCKVGYFVNNGVVSLDRITLMCSISFNKMIFQSLKALLI